VAISLSDIRPADAAGATDEEIADTLLAIAPVTGLGAVVSNRTARASVSAARWADPSSANVREQDARARRLYHIT